MSVRITDNTPRVKSDAERRYNIAIRLMIDAIDQESIPNTPKDKGDLRNNKLKQVLGSHGKIAWLQHYSVFQESKQFVHYTTSGTGPHFAEKAVKKVTSDAAKYFRQAGL